MWQRLSYVKIMCEMSASASWSLTERMTQASSVIIVTDRDNSAIRKSQSSHFYICIKMCLLKFSNVKIDCFYALKIWNAMDIMIKLTIPFFQNVFISSLIRWKSSGRNLILEMEFPCWACLLLSIIAWVPKTVEETKSLVCIKKEIVTAISKIVKLAFTNTKSNCQSQKANIFIVYIIVYT